MFVRGILLFLLSVSSLRAGPIASLRMDNGVVVRSEILFADADFFYCRKVTDANSTFTYPVGKAPQSLRRRVQYLLEKGELTVPPAAIAKEEPEVEAALGPWTLIDRNDPEAGPVVKVLRQVGRANYAGQPSLNFRFYRKQYEAYIDFDHKITFVKKWPVAYQVDDGPLIKESWRLNDVGRVAFSPRAFHMRDQLKGGRVLRVYMQDYKSRSCELHFDLNGFDAGIEELEQGLGL